MRKIKFFIEKEIILEEKDYFKVLEFYKNNLFEIEKMSFIERKADQIVIKDLKIHL